MDNMIQNLWGGIADIAQSLWSLVQSLGLIPQVSIGVILLVAVVWLFLFESKK